MASRSIRRGIGVFVAVVCWPAIARSEGLRLEDAVQLALQNSILLVEYANQVREHEPTLSAAEAMTKEGPLRLRPILMTTVATLMSAVPPILGLGPGTETRSPMAATVLGGLTVSTILSLLVVPAFYVTSDRAKGHQASLFSGKKQPAHDMGS